MQRKTIEAASVVDRIVCDRCGKEVERGGPELSAMTSIDFLAGYASIFGDGNRVELDLCEPCLRDTLGTWLRVKAPEATPLEVMLEAFRPEVRGGEFPPLPSPGLEELADRARAAADRASAAMEEALGLVRASNERIAAMEARAGTPKSDG